MRGFGSRRLRAYAAWDARAVRRALVLGALGAALIAAAVVMAGKDDEGWRVRSTPLTSSPVENPLAPEFARCNGLGNAAVDDAGCRAAWAENRRRFFGGRAHPAPER